MNTFITLCNKPTKKAYYAIRRSIKKSSCPVLWALVAFMVLSVAEVMILALLNHSFVRMGDIIFHNDRSLELWSEICHGHLSLFNLYVGYPRGIATNVFYPWRAFLPLALLRLTTSSPLKLMYESLIIVSFLHYLISFYSYRTYDHDDKRAFAFSILYSLGAVTFWWGYLAEDFGADLAIAFLPMVFFGFIAFIRRDHVVLLSAGLLLVLSSHLVTALLAVVLLAVMYIFHTTPIAEQSYVHLFLASCVVVALSLPTLVPMAYLARLNHLVYPADINTFSGGLMNYTPDFFGILVPVLVIIAMCLHWHKSRLDWELFWVGIFSVIINVRWVGLLLLKILPSLSKLQFAIRFDIISNLAFAFLLVDFCRKYSTKPKLVEKSIIRASMLGILLISIPCYEFTSPSSLLKQPSLTAQKYHHLIGSMTHAHFAVVEYKINNHEIEQMAHNTVYTDYSPSVSIPDWRAFLQHHLVSVSRRPATVPDTHVVSAESGIHIFSRHNLNNVQIPIVLYRGVKYRITCDGRLVHSRDVNVFKSKQYRSLVMKHLTKGRHTFKLQKATIHGKTR